MTGKDRVCGRIIICGAQVERGKATNAGFAELHEDLTEGRITCEESVREELFNIVRHNPKFNSFITVFDQDSQPALEAAKRSDGKIARNAGRTGELEGVPMAIKDNFFFSGYRTTDACAAFKDFVPNANASLVESLLGLGLVPLGKTNMHELAFGATSSSSLFGPVRNPWDSERVSGGSSGGTAVSVALSKRPILGLGSDTGGSIRVPAALCGVFGFKPTIGLLSTEGVFPLGATLDHSGLMTKTMPDMMAVFQALTGQRWSEKARRRRRRIGIPQKHFGEEMDRGVFAAFWRAVDRLRALDEFEMVENSEFPNATRTTIVRTAIQFREAAWFYEEIIRTEKLRRAMHADVLGLLDRGSRIGMAQYMHANLARVEFIGEMNRIFRAVDLIMMPTCLIVAPRLEDVVGKEAGRIRPLLLKNTEPFNLCGFPALSLPAIKPGNRLPVGIQLAGRFGEDMEVLRVGEVLARALS